MNIYYDNIIFSLQQSGGVSIYWSELCQRASEDEHQVTFFEEENTNHLSKTLHLLRQRESSLPIGLLRMLPFQKELTPPGIFHSSYYRYTNQTNIKNIVTVHDFTPEKFGSGLRKAMHRIIKRKALRKADGIICQSENTRKDLLKFYPELSHIPAKVIYPGVHTAYKPIEKNNSNKPPYLLFVGSRASYKNFTESVLGVSILPLYEFVIVGGGDLTAKESVLLEKRLPGRYTKKSFISNEDLNILYNNAHALLYPSLYEGFGIPVAEALSANCPVITSNISSLPEVSGGHGILLRALQANTIADAIRRFEDHLLRDQITKAGMEYAQRFSWDKCYKETLNFYEHILNKLS